MKRREFISLLGGAAAVVREVALAITILPTTFLLAVMLPATNEL